MRIETTDITDGNKRNELILYANSLGCKAVYNPRNNGMDIEVVSSEKIKKIKDKIEQLKG